MRSAIEIQGTATLIVLASIQSCGNNSFGIYIVVTEVCSGISALKFCLCCGNVNVGMNGIKLIISPNGTNVGLINLLLVAGFSAIADHYCSSKLLIKSHAHYTILIIDNIEIGDINDIVSLELVLNINGLGISRTIQKSQISDKALLLTLLVALSSDICAASICLTGTNAANGTLMGLSEYAINPGLISSNKLRCAGLYILILGEQGLDISNSMLQSIASLLCEDTHCGSETAYIVGLCKCNNVLLICVSEYVLVFLFVKYIVLHAISSFIIGVIAVFIIFASGHSDHSVNHIFLLIIERFKDFRNCFIFLLFFVVVVLHFFVLFLLFICVIKNKLFSGIDNCFVRFFTMHDDRIYKCSRICSSENKANLTDYSMHDSIAILLKLVRANRKGHNVTMLHKSLGISSLFSIIERTICIHSFIAMLEYGIAKNAHRIAMVMAPNKRYCCAIHIFKCAR